MEKPLKSWLLLTSQGDLTDVFFFSLILSQLIGFWPVCEWGHSLSLWSFTGDITQKGYEKKRTKLLAPYILHTPGRKHTPSLLCEHKRQTPRKVTCLIRLRSFSSHFDAVTIQSVFCSDLVSCVIFLHVQPEPVNIGFIHLLKGKHNQFTEPVNEMLAVVNVLKWATLYC